MFSRCPWERREWAVHEVRGGDMGCESEHAIKKILRVIVGIHRMDIGSQYSLHKMSRASRWQTRVRMRDALKYKLRDEIEQRIFLRSMSESGPGTEREKRYYIKPLHAH